jgi:hypothetical protein
MANPQKCECRQADQFMQQRPPNSASFSELEAASAEVDFEAARKDYY